GSRGSGAIPGLRAPPGRRRGRRLRVRLPRQVNPWRWEGSTLVLLGSMATPAWWAGAGGRAFRGDRQVPLPYFSVGSRLWGAGAALRTRVTMPAATMVAPGGRGVGERGRRRRRRRLVQAAAQICKRARFDVRAAA